MNDGIPFSEEVWEHRRTNRMYISRRELTDVIQEHIGCDRDQALSLTDRIVDMETKTQQIHFDLQELSIRIDAVKANYNLEMADLIKEREEIQDRCNHSLDHGSCKRCGYTGRTK